MTQKGVGKAQISLRVLKINRVDFVRHGGTAHLALADFLMKVAHRNVLPEITAQIQQDDLDAYHVMTKSRQVIVVFNLGGVTIARQPKGILDKSIGKSWPVRLGPDQMMGVEIPGSSPEFGSNRNIVQHF